MINREDMLKIKIDELYNENGLLQQEIVFLRQRNKDLRQKSYINVYDENLQLIKTVDQLRKELIKVGEIADRFRKDAVDLQKENLHLKDVLKSVEAFCQQYTVR